MPALDNVFWSLVARCEAVSSQLGIVTDGVHSVFMRLAPSQHRLPSSRYVQFQEISCALHPLAYCLAAAMNDVSRSLKGHNELLSGVSNRSGPFFNTPTVEFRDFDIYHMGLDRTLYWEFLTWKDAIATRDAQHQPTIGSVITLARRDMISSTTGKFTPFRCNDPIWPLSETSELALRCRLRPRNDELRTLLAGRQQLVFEVSEIKQQGTAFWSQVYFGRLGIAGARHVDEEICLKLFDERFLPVPSLERYDSRPEGFKVSALQCADVMIRREESAYHRLASYQVTLLPQCYGCHEVPLGRSPVG